MARVQGAWLPVKSRARWGGMLWLMARWGGAFSPLIVGRMLSVFNSDAWRRWVGGTFLEHVAAWRMGFWLSGLVGVVWVLLFWPFFRDRPADKRGVNAAELKLIEEGRATSTTADSHHMPAGLWRDLFTSPALWAMALLYIHVSFGWSFFASWFPRFFQERHNVPFNRPEC